MTFSLYKAIIPQYQQMLGALAALLDEAEAWCAKQGIEPETVIQSRLAEDMHPFAYQVKSAAVHSAGAVAGVRKGEFRPETRKPPETFAKLKERIAEALAEIDKVTPEQMESFIGRDMVFLVRFATPYRAEKFLLSFSQPNFYFHVSTAYALLRAKGMPIGKKNYLGRLQTRRKRDEATA
jgi:hypothetical protein